MGTFRITKTLFKSLFRKPATKMHPVVEKEWKEITRGHVDIDKDLCILCGMCMRKCPADAIAVKKADSTWEIQRMQCIQCGSCVEVCPKKCLTMKPEYTTPGTEKVVDLVEIPKKEKPAPKAAPAPKAEAAAPAGGTAEGVILTAENCIACGICAKQCPVEAIEVDRQERTWSIDRDGCVSCGACTDKCPKKCIEIGTGAADGGVETFKVPDKKPAPKKEA